MVFPVVANATTQTDGGAGASHNIPVMPCAIGDVILVWCGINDFPGGVTSVAGFVTIVNINPGNDWCFMGRRVVDGTEPWFNGGAGGNAVMTHAAATSCAYQVMRITGADPGAPTALVFPFATVTSGLVTAPDPPLLAPAWGSSDTLWMAAFTQHDGSALVTSYPAGYTTMGHAGVGNSFLGVHEAIAWKTSTAASEDPGAFATTSTSAGTVAATFGMRSLAISHQGVAVRSGPLRRFSRY